MKTLLPSMYRDTRRLLAHTTEVARRFDHYHKYTVGADRRTQANPASLSACTTSKSAPCRKFLVCKSDNQPCQEVAK
jgi:hypothetical protein